MSKELAEAGRLAIQVGTSAGGATIAIAGASGAAISAATVIAATGGAAAVVLVGVGLYKWLASDTKKGG